MKYAWSVVRVVVDTNTIVSGVLTPAGAPGAVLTAFRDGRFTLITSEPMLAEVDEVLRRPRIAGRYGIQAGDVDALVALMRERAEVVHLTGEIRVCRDPDDDMLIEAALVGNAGVLVTRDEDLVRDLAVIDHLDGRGVAVMTVRHFLEALESPEKKR